MNIYHVQVQEQPLHIWLVEEPEKKNRHGESCGNKLQREVILSGRES